MPWIALAPRPCTTQLVCVWWCVCSSAHAQASADMRHRILSMQLTCKCTYGMCACVRARAVRVTGGGRVEAVRLLLQYGADANARSS